MGSNEKLHAEIPIERSIATKKKRKAQRDPDASKKQAGLKRRRKDPGSPSPADFMALNEDNHHNGPNSQSINFNNSDSSMKDDAMSKASRSAPTKMERKVIESNSSLAAANDSSDVQRDDLSMKRSGSNSDYDSEDEAPETVSAAAGLLQSRQVAADVAKAEERKKAARKSKRREHDIRLKMQAKSTKERALRDQTSSQDPQNIENASKDTVVGTDGASEAAKWSIGDPLPEFLPDEILAAIPETPSAPLPSKLPSRKEPVRNKLKIFQNMSNPRKRIKRGSTVYQFLEDDGGILPPKVAKRSKSLRESWLSGRKGARGEEIIRRRKIGGGFVRK